MSEDGRRFVHKQASAVTPGAMMPRVSHDSITRSVYFLDSPDFILKYDIMR